MKHMRKDTHLKVLGKHEKMESEGRIWRLLDAEIWREKQPKSKPSVGIRRTAKISCETKKRSYCNYGEVREEDRGELLEEASEEAREVEVGDSEAVAEVVVAEEAEGVCFEAWAEDEQVPLGAVEEVGD